MDPLTAILVLIGTTISNVLSIFYIRRTDQGKALPASFFASLLVLIGGSIVIIYVENKLYLIPAIFGTFLGTFISIKYDTHIKKHFKKFKRRR